MSKVVREPIQVYLTPEEREELDAAARELGVSRSEALRRGLKDLRRTRYAGPLRDLTEDGVVTPRRAGPGDPPPRFPVASWEDLRRELDEDRADR